MGLMTLNEMRLELHLLLGQRSEVDPDETTGEARLNRWINNAYRWACIPKVFKQNAMQRTHDLILSADQPDFRYPLADDTEFLYFVRNVDQDRRYDPEKLEEFFQRSGGDQRTWARFGDSIYMRASASSDGQTVRTYYYARPELLLEDAQTTLIHEWWDQVIIQKAGFYGWSILGNLTAADFHRESAAALANDAAEALAHEAHAAGWQNDIQGVEG